MTTSSENGHVPYASLEEIECFIAAFEKCTLPKVDWTHRAHLTMATWYLAGHPPARATQLIRGGILKLNDALGIVSNADSGYHETITLFYIGTIRHHLHNAAAGTSLLSAINSLLATRGHKDLPLEYYSRERLRSHAARAGWIGPDLKSLEWDFSDGPRGV